MHGGPTTTTSTAHTHSNILHLSHHASCLSHSSSLFISLCNSPPLSFPPFFLFPVFFQLAAVTNRKGLKHFITHSIPAVLRSTVFLSLNGGPLLFWICVLRWGKGEAPNEWFCPLCMCIELAFQWGLLDSFNLKQLKWSLKYYSSACAKSRWPVACLHNYEPN